MASLEHTYSSMDFCFGDFYVREIQLGENRFLQNRTNLARSFLHLYIVSVFQFMQCPQFNAPVAHFLFFLSRSSRSCHRDLVKLYPDQVPQQRNSYQHSICLQRPKYPHFRIDLLVGVRVSITVCD